MRDASDRSWKFTGALGAPVLALLALAVLPLAALPQAALADESDPTDVGLKDAVDRATNPERERAAVLPVHVGLRVGEARFVRDLARVDVTLEATNTTAGVLEWERVFPMDPAAELIGCSLQRAGGIALAARTLTFEDGRRIYDETVRPRPTTPNPGKDPLRVERETDGALRVVVFPMAVGETVRVKLSFVTSLADRGQRRSFHDPIWMDAAPTRQGEVPTAPSTGTLTTLLVEPGNLAFDRTDTGLVSAGLSGERLLFRAGNLAEAGLQAHVRFSAPAGVLPALTVSGGGLGTQVAFWHMDPAVFLAERGITEVPAGAVLRFTGRGGYTQRVVPAEIPADGRAVTLTARLIPQAGEMTFDAELVAGERLERFPVTLKTERADADADLIDAVTGWYRARLARHVLAWAEADPAARRAKAVAYAVDLGVLLPGTCALAMPRDEQRALSPESRRTYRRDGTEVGSPGGEADWVAPPSGSIR